MQNKTLSLIGLASCWGAQDRRCDLGPLRLRDLDIEGILAGNGINACWQAMLTRRQSDDFADIFDLIAQTCEELREQVATSSGPCVVMGGDHSCAIGTWSAIWQQVHSEGPLGLLWIDAHMDAHTPATSPSGAAHGMPLAALLGHGDPRLTTLGGNPAKLQPENVCIIGVRSYEAGEADLLSRLGVRIFYMDEINQRGMQAVTREALQIVTRNTVGFGVSIDLDAIDPEDAPGVGSPEPGGIAAEHLLNACALFRHHPALAGLEIAELNPSLDIDDKTAMLTIEIIKRCYD